jgi:hypothetical protein
MKKLLIALCILSSCKKEELKYVYIEREGKVDSIKYTPTVTQDTIQVTYSVDSDISNYIASYSKFYGFDKNGIEIIKRVTDTITDGDHDFTFTSVTSPFGRKYNYEIFITTNSTDSTLISIFIDNQLKIYRPNYGQSYNFANTWY